MKIKLNMNNFHQRSIHLCESFFDEASTKILNRDINMILLEMNKLDVH